MQMGRIPLLTRKEEIESAQEIESTRINYRNTMLATDFMLQGATELLENVRDGKLRLDRTIEVSVTNKTEKKRIMQRLVPNVDTLRKLLEANEKDFQYAINPNRDSKKRASVWRRLTRRRNRAVRLIEELNLRISRLQPLFQQLCDVQQRMELLYRQLHEAAETGLCRQPHLGRSSCGPAFPDEEDCGKPENTETSGANAPPGVSNFTIVQTRFVGRQLAVGRLDCQKIPKSRIEFSGSHPGRQHRIDACGR